MIDSKKIDFDEAMKAIKNDQPLFGKEGILKPLIKNLTELVL